MEPAASIIRLLGGNKKVAEILGVAPERVAAWKQSKRHRGGNGVIPLKHTLELLAYAQANGIRLTPEMFRPRDENCGERAA